MGIAVAEELMLTQKVVEQFRNLCTFEFSGFFHVSLLDSGCQGVQQLLKNNIKNQVHF